MNFLKLTLMSNVVATVAAFAVGYVVVSVTMSFEFRYSRAGDWMRTAADGGRQDLLDGDDPIGDLQRSWNRSRFLFGPVALLVSAALVAALSLRWQWSWLLTLVGCSYGLAFMALASSSNLGYGIAVALTAYLPLAIVVTIIVYARERRGTRAA